MTFIISRRSFIQGLGAAALGVVTAHLSPALAPAAEALSPEPGSAARRRLNVGVL